MVTSIPHISLNLYELFKPKLKDLLSNNITVDEIAKMKYNSGKSLGIKKANQIKKSLNKLHFKNDTTLPIKVLSQIKNISKATATLLLEHYKFDFFLNLTDETTEELLNFTINGKKQTKKLENIVEIFKLLS